MVHIQDGFCFLAQMFYNMKIMFFALMLNMIAYNE